ncbi:hypothetical protein L0337_22175 [candidate division KSB1 bacterium]|nr:hypothetical protein [candidate division KSB1 bacterium]
MRKKSFLLLCIFLTAALFISRERARAVEGGNRKPAQRLAKTTADSTTNRTLVNIGNVAMWIVSDGRSATNPTTNAPGLYFPRGTNPLVATIFQDGFIWGGQVNDGNARRVRVGGQDFNIGTVPGAIISRGVAENANDGRMVDRVWRVRRDFATANLRQDAAEFFLTTAAQVTEAQIQQVRDLYRRDWIDWPAYKGAPFYDADGDGQYAPQFNDDGTPKLVPRAGEAYDPAKHADEPGYADGDQVLWLVANDLNAGTAELFSGSPPIGIEMQLTLWAYRRADALGNVIFKQFRIIYKGTAITPANATIDSMYFCQFVDPDLGSFGDDYVGCDTTLSLGYVYNSQAVDGNYAAIGLPPPAAGYDFFAGPLVPAPNDVAIFGLKERPGFRNLPMTSFAYFAAGQEDSDPDTGENNYLSTLQWYNLLRGFRPRPESPPDPWRDPARKVTKFRVPGDPISNSGWLDSVTGDRRLLQSTGPFTMALGDTQETVIASISALGSDRLSSIAVLKFFDRFAQDAFDNLFQLPKPPALPNPIASEYDGQIFLNWASNPAGVAATENETIKGYAFEGYNVYQLPTAGASVEQGIKLATFDVNNSIRTISQETFDPRSGLILNLPVQFGNDTGISRTFLVDRDRLRDAPLINGQPYYFGVTAYSYNADPNVASKTLESPPAIVTVVPQTTKPGVRLASTPGDSLTVRHEGPSDGTAVALVLDPLKANGHDYEVTFSDDGHGGFVWALANKTASKIVLSSQSNQSGDGNYLLTDGLQVKVVGPPPGMKEFQIPSGARRWTFAGADGFHLEGLSGAVGMAFNQWFSSSTITPPQLHNVLIKLAGTDTDGQVLDPNDPNQSYGYRYLRRADQPAEDTAFTPFIINPSAGYAYQDYVKNVPFAAYDMETNPPTRLMVGYLENNDAGGRVDGRYWPPYSDEGVDNVALTREWFFVFAVPYGETPDPALQADILNATLPLMWWGTPNRRGGNIAFQATDEFLIVANRVNSAADKFTFTSRAPRIDRNVAKQDIAKLVKAFPNPYRGFNRFEQNNFTRFITFSHLPDKAIIRIFNLAGVLVRTLTKGLNAPDNAQFLRWNLQNEAGLPVASGIYIARLEFPDLGMTKDLKIAIVQEQQFLRNF